MAGVAFILVIWAAFQSTYWDEQPFHLALVNVIARGVIPPEYAFAPGQPLPYHYAFDSLAAQIRALTGVSALLAIDLVTIACYGMLLLVAWSLGVEAGGRGAGSAALVLAPLGTGALLHSLWVGFGWFELQLGIYPSSWRHVFLPPPSDLELLFSIRRASACRWRSRCCS